MEKEEKWFKVVRVIEEIHFVVAKTKKEAEVRVFHRNDPQTVNLKSVTITLEK